MAEQKEKVGKGAEGMQKEEERGGLKWMRLEGASGKLCKKSSPRGTGTEGTVGLCVGCVMSCPRQAFSLLAYTFLHCSDQSPEIRLFVKRWVFWLMALKRGPEHGAGTCWALGEGILKGAEQGC